MPLRTAPPAPELVAELRSQHARRYPEKALLPVIGDGGLPIDLPLLLGNPTGSVKPADPRAFPAWANIVAATLRGRGSAAMGLDLVRDCLLYPDRGTLAEWETRWPAIVDSLSPIVFRKIGAVPDVLRAPRVDEDPPAPIAELLAGMPAASWRWIDLYPAPVPVVISAPSHPHWQALTTALGREGADCIALLDELVSVCCKGEGVAALVAQWPGVALMLDGVIVKMAGAAADARLGEW